MSSAACKREAGARRASGAFCKRRRRATPPRANLRGSCAAGSAAGRGERGSGGGGGCGKDPRAQRGCSAVAGERRARCSSGRPALCPPRRRAPPLHASSWGAPGGQPGPASRPADPPLAADRGARGGAPWRAPSRGSSRPPCGVGRAAARPPFAGGSSCWELVTCPRPRCGAGASRTFSQGGQCLPIVWRPFASGMLY